MKVGIPVLGLCLMTTPALAETIAPCDASKYVGKSVTVEGLVSQVHHAASGKATFLDMGGQYPNNCFAGVLFSGDESKFPDIDSLEGKTIDITGTIKLYKRKPEIILDDPAQIKAK